MVIGIVLGVLAVGFLAGVLAVVIRLSGCLTKESRRCRYLAEIDDDARGG